MFKVHINFVTKRKNASGITSIPPYFRSECVVLCLEVSILFLPHKFSNVNVCFSPALFLSFIMTFLHPLILDMLTHLLFNRIFDSIQVKLNALSRITFTQTETVPIEYQMAWNGMVYLRRCMQE